MEDWHVLPYLVAEEHILAIISKWLSDWHTSINTKIIVHTRNTIAEMHAEKKDLKKGPK